ncbi:hypothetical protein COOONC_01291, partial [Cooperia oncophora]
LFQKPSDENKSARTVGHIKVPIVKHGPTKKYQIERGRKIESLLGVNKDGDELMYMVRYKGPEPQHHRTEMIPSSVLRRVAMKEFVDSLEQFVIANGPFIHV